MYGYARSTGPAIVDMTGVLRALSLSCAQLSPPCFLVLAFCSLGYGIFYLTGHQADRAHGRLCPYDMLLLAGFLPQRLHHFFLHVL